MNTPLTFAVITAIGIMGAMLSPSYAQEIDTNWEYHEWVDDWNDLRNTAIATWSTVQYRNEYGLLRDGYMTIRCNNIIDDLDPLKPFHNMKLRSRAGTSIDLIIGVQRGDELTGGMMYRIGTTDTVRTTMNKAADTESIIALWNDEGIEIIEKMFDHDKFIVKLEAEGNYEIELKFDITGLEEAVKPIMEPCTWQPDQWIEYQLEKVSKNLEGEKQ